LQSWAGVDGEENYLGLNGKKKKVNLEVEEEKEKAQNMGRNADECPLK